MNNKLQDELESIVDASCLTAVIKMLAQVCYEKADHLRSNWQDEEAAQTWNHDADLLNSTAARLDN